MRADDIQTLISLGRPALAPDGSFAVVASSRPDIAANTYVGQLWRVEVPSGDRRRLTRGVADRAPALSPDGSALAFLRSDADGRPQIFVVPATGGDPLQVTDAEAGVSTFRWSPDGGTFAFLSRVPEPGRYGTVDGLGADAEAPRRITGVQWQANGLGYIADRPAQVFVVDVPALDDEPIYPVAPRLRPSGEEPEKPRRVPADARALTTGPASHSALAFSADGTQVLTVPAEIATDRTDLRDRVIAVPIAGGDATEVLGTSAHLSVSDVFTAPDGAVALLASDVGADGRDFVAANEGLFLLQNGSARRLTPAEDIDLGEPGSHITAVGDDFLVQNRTRGRVELLRVGRDGTIESVVAGDVDVAGHASTLDGSTIVASASGIDTAGELHLVGNGPLTDFGLASQQSGITHPVEHEITARDGYPVHGWVATPGGEGPFPVILQIHGGPYASYGIHLFDETQVLVDAGYAVVYCNPRGSAGYGQAHGRAIRGAMGTVDLTDVLDFLDGVLAEHDRLDSTRVGIMGGSYGGYLTAWTIAHDHRFAAAIVERGFLEPESFQGTSDIGSFFGDEYVGTSADAIARQSPMAVVSQVTTPTLVVHSELDFRCPLEQATRYYSALKRQGTDTEMLIFPGENHELTRGGQPRHRIERFAAIVDWWARYLPVS